MCNSWSIWRGPNGCQNMRFILELAIEEQPCSIAEYSKNSHKESMSFTDRQKWWFSFKLTTKKRDDLTGAACSCVEPTRWIIKSTVDQSIIRPQSEKLKSHKFRLETKSKIFACEDN